MELRRLIAQYRQSYADAVEDYDDDVAAVYAEATTDLQALYNMLTTQCNSCVVTHADE